MAMADTASLQHRLLLSAAALLLAAAATRATAAEPNIVWVENDSFGFSACGDVPGANAGALPGIEDPKALLDALRERGMADAHRQVQARHTSTVATTLTPVSGSLRCAGPTPEVVFRISSFDRVTGQAWTSHMVTQFPLGAHFQNRSSASR
jgi:hypothetical protein